MKLIDIKKLFYSELENVFEKNEIDAFIKRTTEEYLNLKPFELALNTDMFIEKHKEEMFLKVISELKKEKPIQQILGKTYFYGLEFIINAHVLIPRPETEELVHWIINDNKLSTSELKILDIGTGSGCIAVSLAKNLPGSVVFAVDVSQEALNVARRNAEKNSIEVGYMQMDILKADKLPSQFDVIVSNPPYVRFLEKDTIKKNVLEYEPHLALFVDNEDPLLFYDKISKLSMSYLNDKGSLYFEINQYLGVELIELLEKNGFKKIELKKGLFGNNRFIKCIK